LTADAANVRSTSTEVLALIKEGAERSASLCRVLEQIAATHGVRRVQSLRDGTLEWAAAALRRSLD